MSKMSIRKILKAQRNNAIKSFITSQTIPKCHGNLKNENEKQLCMKFSSKDTQFLVGNKQKFVEESEILQNTLKSFESIFRVLCNIQIHFFYIRNLDQAI